MAAGQGRILDVVVEWRGRVDAVVANAGELAATLGAKGDCLNGRGLMTNHRVHLRAGQLQADRPAQNLRGKRGQHRVGPGPGLAAVAAAEKLAHDVDLFLRDSENERSHLPRTHDHLRGVVER